MDRKLGHFPVGIEKKRSALLKIVPDIEAALDLLAEYSEDISRSYKDKIEARKPILA